jgi:hypothetical protein
MLKTRLKIKIPGMDDVECELEPGAAIMVEADPEEEDDGASEDDRASHASGWSRVAGFSDLPAPRREALADLGPMRRALSILPRDRALPAGFVRKSEDSHIFLLSEPVVGRDGYVLAGPWNLTEYNANPVVLYQHNDAWSTPGAAPDDMLPVGRALQVVETSEGVLISEIAFDKESPRGAKLDRLYRQGFLSAVSARWWPESILPANKLPAESPYYHDDSDVFVMFGNTLLEQSAVVLPGLASATLIEGPIDAPRALAAARAHVSDPQFRSDLEAVILSAPAPRAEPAAAEPSPAPQPRGWWGLPTED